MKEFKSPFWHNWLKFMICGIIFLIGTVLILNSGHLIEDYSVRLGLTNYLAIVAIVVPVFLWVLVFLISFKYVPKLLDRQSNKINKSHKTQKP